MKILCLSPHTDDIELGCGGSLTKWMKHEIKVIAFSACEESIPDGFDSHTTRKEFYENMSLIGATGVVLGFRVRYFFRDRQKILEALVAEKKWKPDLVIIPSLSDIHQDHRVIYEEGLRAYRDISNVIGYENPYNNLEFKPNYYVDLELIHVHTKIDLINTYKSQKVKGQAYFDEEYVKGWAKMRGSQVKMNYAEAFEVYRWRG